MAATNGQESDARGVSVNADKMEIIKGVKVYEYTRYGGLYFQIGFYTFRFETFHGGDKDLQRLLLKVCSVLISEFNSDVASRIPVGTPPSSLSVEAFKFIGPETTIQQVIKKLGQPIYLAAGGFLPDKVGYYLSDGSQVYIGFGDGGKIVYVTHGKETLFGHDDFAKLMPP